MIRYTINQEQRYARTEWAELTLGEYLAIAASDSTNESLCLLSGLTPAEMEHPQAAPIVQACHALLESEPFGIKPEWLGQKLGGDAIGKMELSRKYLREHEEPEQAFPFLYAVYRWPEDYDAVYAMSGAGFPAELLEKAKAVPLVEVLGAVFHIMSEMQELDKRYGPLLEKEPTEEQYRAGIDRFEKYGFYATLTSYCSGDMTRAKELLQLPANVFYTMLCIDTERSDYEEKYREIMSKQG
ncbi:hypothetical protein [Pontibacter rugosus]|uniref:Uncharacterized protein n=1 Tax=Pontibacter rugosus TaxID=1745966 RepID=A0ABW3SJY4_9BACT